MKHLFIFLLLFLITASPVEATKFHSPTPTVTATASATIRPTTPPAPHGDGLSDGHSDGKTDSLGCQRPEDLCGVQQLPMTGALDITVALISVLLFLLGVWILRLATLSENSSGNQMQ